LLSSISHTELLLTFTPLQIPGTTNVDRLEENLGALKIKLSKEEEAEIRQASEAAVPAGARYPEAFAKHNFADTPALS
jgi:diketogulonate reductase-like aldo/keto reductase